MESALHFETITLTVTGCFEHLPVHKLQVLHVALIRFIIGDAECFCEIRLAHFFLRLPGFLQVLLLIPERSVVIVLLRFQALLGAFLIEVGHLTQVLQFCQLDSVLVLTRGEFAIYILLLKNSHLFLVGDFLLLHSPLDGILTLLFECFLIGGLNGHFLITYKILMRELLLVIRNLNLQHTLGVCFIVLFAFRVSDTNKGLLTLAPIVLGLELVLAFGLIVIASTATGWVTIGFLLNLALQRIDVHFVHHLSNLPDGFLCLV